MRMHPASGKDHTTLRNDAIFPAMRISVLRSVLVVPAGIWLQAAVAAVLMG
jgi:hypothetical protein